MPLSQYKGLQLVVSPTGAGGVALNENIEEIADRAPTYHATGSNPGVTHDGVDTAALGTKFYARSLWINTSTDAVYICTDNSTGAAVWQRLDNVGGGGSGDMLAANNLSDVANASTARTNLGLGTAATHAHGDYDAAGDAAAAQAAAIAASAQRASNLSDLASASTARTNLGLGTAATHAHGDYDAAGDAAAAQAAAIAASAQRASNLSDLASASTARTNLGLGTAAVAATGDFDAAGTGAAAQAAAIAASAQRASNLSDLASASTARTNLGLGTAAVAATGAFDPAGTGAAAQAAAIAASAQRASNLSDLASASTARTNLGLGTAAVAATTDFVAAGSSVEGGSAGETIGVTTSVFFTNGTTSVTLPIGANTTGDGHEVVVIAQNDCTVYGNSSDLITLPLGMPRFGPPGTQNQLSLLKGDAVTFRWCTAGTDTWHIVSNLDNRYLSSSPPTIDDDIDLGFVVGSLYIDSTNFGVYWCTSNNDGAAAWRRVDAPFTDNFSGAPTATDDITLGYLVGDRWYSTDLHQNFYCYENTDGAASWEPDLITVWDWSDPDVTNDESQGFQVGGLWFNQSTRATWICADVTTNAADWRVLHQGYGYADTASGALTIDFSTGHYSQSIILEANSTFTFTDPRDYLANLTLSLIQDATGSRTVTWPGGVKWPGGTAPTLSTDADAVDIFTFYWDGGHYFGRTYGLNYSLA